MLGGRLRSLHLRRRGTVTVCPADAWPYLENGVLPIYRPTVCS
jgi:hypothetical protein